jgi:integrase
MPKGKGPGSGSRAPKGEGSIYETSFIDKRTGKLVKRFQGQITIPQELGKSKRTTVTGKTRTEVKRKMNTLQRQLDDNTLSQTALTLDKYLKQKWLPHKQRQVKPRTVELYQENADRYVIPRIGMIRLDKLSPLKVQEMMNDIAEKVGPNAANKARTMLRAALGQAVRWQLIPRNVCEAVEPLKETPREMTIWQPDEVIRFLGVARAHRLYAAFYLALLTGMRRGEVLGLRWQDVDPRGTIHVRQSLTIIGGKPALTSPKTERGIRRVAISPDLVEVLEQHRQHQEAERAALELVGVPWPAHDLVFITEVGTPINPRNFERTWYALQEKARQAYIDEGEDEAIRQVRRQDIASGKAQPKIRLHDLRHLNVSLRRKTGQDANLIADQIGHTDPGFTQRVYMHLFQDDRREAAVSLANVLSARSNLN